MRKRRPLRLNPRPSLGDALQLGARQILLAAVEDCDESDADPAAIDHLVQCASVLLHLQAENEVPREARHV